MLLLTVKELSRFSSLVLFRLIAEHKLNTWLLLVVVAVEVTSVEAVEAGRF
jgi:hypothetical protein